MGADKCNGNCVIKIGAKMRELYDPIQNIVIFEESIICNQKKKFVSKELKIDKEWEENDKKEVKILCEGTEYIFYVSLKKAKKNEKKTYTKRYRAYRYLKKNGVKHFVKKVKSKLLKTDVAQFEKYFKRTSLSKQQLQNQRKNAKGFALQPLISFVCPLFMTDEKFLKELIRSIEEQTYENWELVLLDASPSENSLEALIETKDARIHYIGDYHNDGIAQNTNKAIEQAKGAYIALIDHDDVLAPEALFMMVEYINKNPDVKMIYSDEDKIGFDNNTHFEPNFKPDFSLFFLRSINYICHLTVLEATFLKEELKGFRINCDGAQDHDLFLRACEKIKNIGHIPRILYHWRAHMNSTAINPESKNYAFIAGKKVIEEHFERLSIPAKVEFGPFPGAIHIRYSFQERPLVSIVIPNKDHIENLEKCLTSLFEQKAYTNFEVIVIENNSQEKSTFDFYEQQKDKIRLITYQGEFNYAAINNYGIKEAKGDYILLLNNDVYLEKEDSLYTMVMTALNKNVGIVGAKLLYPDNTIQHAGVFVGMLGTAGHLFYNMPNEPGYQARAILTSNVSAVTGACLLIKRSIFDEAGGLDETLSVAWNDIDLCLKVREKGYEVVYEANAVWIHEESKSRGYETTREKKLRFEKETEIFKNRWAAFIQKGDPYYNSNLTLRFHNCQVKSEYELEEYENNH